MTIEAQYDDMIRHGISFCRHSKPAVMRLLADTVSYDHLCSFFDCFSRYTDKSNHNYGKFIRLDFTELVALLQIDDLFRMALLGITLQTERSLRLYLNNLITGDEKTGNKIVKDFLAANHKAKTKLADTLNHARSNIYLADCSDVSVRNITVTQLLNVMTLGDLIFFYRYYADNHNIHNRFDNLLYSVRIVRNAAAHGNCMLNQIGHSKPDFRPSEYLFPLIQKYIPSLTKGQRKSAMYIPVLHDFAAALFAYIFIVRDEQSFITSKQQMLALMLKMQNCAFLFCKEQKLINGFDFINQSIHFFINHKIS